MFVRPRIDSWQHAVYRWLDNDCRLKRVASKRHPNDLLNAMSDAVRVSSDADCLEFDDVRGVTWTTGTMTSERGKTYRWFRAVERRERRYELRNGEANDVSIASLRQQLHASLPMT